MDYREIDFEKQGNIAILTLNRPDVRNTITEPEIINEILEALVRVQADGSISVLILTAADPAFSAGGNVKDMYNRQGTFAGDPDRIRNNYRQGIQQIPLAFEGLDVPVICAVNGPAIGAGCDLTLMCDIRIASEKARFGETFASVGLIPGDGGAYFLPRAVGWARALELAFTCRVIDAAEALRIGLVSEVVPHDQLLPRALALAGEIAGQPGRILRLAKRLFYLTWNKSLAETLEISAAFQALCHHSPEHMAALEAFFARQKERAK